MAVSNDRKLLVEFVENVRHVSTWKILSDYYYFVPQKKGLGEYKPSGKVVKRVKSFENEHLLDLQ